MTLAEKYINCSPGSKEANTLFNVFMSIINTGPKSYEACNDEVEEVCDYFCAIGLLQKEADNIYIPQFRHSIIGSFIIFMNALTNRIAVPSVDFLARDSLTKIELLEQRLAFSAGIFIGETMIKGSEIPYVLCTFNKIGTDNEVQPLYNFAPQFMNFRSAMEEVAYLHSVTPTDLGRTVCLLWDRKVKRFVFLSEDDKKYFLKNTNLYREMPMDVFEVVPAEESDAYKELIDNGVPVEQLQDLLGKIMGVVGNNYDISAGIITPENKIMPLTPPAQEGPQEPKYEAVADEERDGTAILKDGKEVYFVRRLEGEDSFDVWDKTNKIIQVMIEADEGK